MNILYLCDEYPPGKHGGIGTVVQTLARQMVKQGHKVTVAGIYYWGYGGEDHFTDEGVQVYRFRYKLASKWFHNYDSLRVRGSYKVLDKLGLLQWDIKRSLAKYRKFLEHLIAEYKIDIAEMPDYSDYMRFCKEVIHFPKLSVPVVVKLHGNMTYFARQAGMREEPQVHEMEHRILSDASAICSVSKYTADKTKEYFNLTKAISVIHNGINTHIATEKEYPINNRVIFSGTLVEKKGIFQLMKAWNIVAEKMDAQLQVYGKGNIDKIRSLLSPRAAESVAFMGHTDRTNLFRQISKSAVCIFPSYAEAFSLAPMEAMACGVCVIFTKRTSGPELVTDGYNGLLVEPDNVEEIAEKIVYALSNRDVREQLAMRGQETVQKEFDLEVIAKQNLAFYTNVINGQDAER
ncbi:MAG: glycosyltransferase family 1 protein [Sphingobacteriales bacterium]|nr:MAG: glycosyltransferase family 1 protein [Sphingobacteriales bacterium]